MYSHKHGRASGAREQARDVLMRTMQAKQPDAARALQRGRRARRRRRPPPGHGRRGDRRDRPRRRAARRRQGRHPRRDPRQARRRSTRPSGSSCASTRSSASGSSTPRRRCARSRGSCARRTSAGTARATPTACAASEIPLGARIVAVCDAYDAMTAERAYRPRRRPRGRLPGAARHGRQPVRPRRSSRPSSPRSSERGAPAPDPEGVEVPVQVLADRVRMLLGSSKLGACPRSPAASTAGGETPPTPPHPARPVPDARLPGPVGRPDAAHAAGRVEPHHRRRRRRRRVAGRGTSCSRCPPRPFTVDIHCVTKWSKLDTTWTGVSVDTLLDGRRRPRPST